MGRSGFVSTSIASTPGPRRMPTPCHACKRPWKAWLAPGTFSCMDLKSGFWQVKMAEESRQYTAFTVGSMGVYEFLRMPYGLCNAPRAVQCPSDVSVSHCKIVWGS